MYGHVVRTCILCGTNVYLGGTRRRWYEKPGILATNITCISLEWNPQGVRQMSKPKRSWRRIIQQEQEDLMMSWDEVKQTAKNCVRQKAVVEQVVLTSNFHLSIFCSQQNTNLSPFFIRAIYFVVWQHSHIQYLSLFQVMISIRSQFVTNSGVSFRAFWPRNPLKALFTLSPT